MKMEKINRKTEIRCIRDREMKKEKI